MSSATLLVPQWRRRISVWRWRRSVCVSAVLLALGTGAAVWATASWIVSLGPAPVGEGLAFSTLVVDRGGNLLRPYTTPEGRWRIAATREDVDPRFLDLLFAYEDKRFASHHGIDPLALGRALVQLIIHR
ncbi:MAG: transglycosylase domain-containing protein, partial [Xanthobacteraceae bacterium]